MTLLLKAPLLSWRRRFKAKGDSRRETDIKEGYVSLFGARILNCFKLLITRNERRDTRITETDTKHPETDDSSPEKRKEKMHHNNHTYMRDTSCFFTTNAVLLSWFSGDFQEMYRRWKKKKCCNNTVLSHLKTHSTCLWVNSAAGHFRLWSVSLVCNNTRKEQQHPNPRRERNHD